jgi:hypothetical protein
MASDTPLRIPGAAVPYGYLLVHFIEDRHAHRKKIYFSLSVGDDPLRWRVANGGAPVLESTIGSTGVRVVSLHGDQWQTLMGAYPPG